MPRTISTMTMAGLLAGALALGSSISTDGAQSKTPAAQQATPPASQQVAPAGEVAFLDTAFPVMSVGTDGHLRAIVYVKNTTKVDDKGTVALTESWSSTLTIAGAILTTFLTFTGLPDYGHIMSKKTYTIASLLFAALIMLAPGVYALFRRTTQVKNETGTKTPQIQGLVLLFLAAAVLTTTGVLAQFKLLGALFSDLGSAGIVSIDTARTFRNICVALQPVLIVYTGVSVYLTIREQAAFEVADTSQRAKYSAEAADAAVRGDKAGEAEATAAAAVPAMRPGWQLL